MQNMWISVALIVAVIIVGIIAGKRLSTPGPQRRAVYFAFGTLAVLALWFFIFVAFFPAEWIVPFFTVACIIIPICVYMMVLRSGGKERAKVPSKRSFEIPKKDITVESAKAASTVSSGTASASSATTPSKAATPAPSASQQTAPASSTPTSAAKTDTSSAPATKAKAPATAAVATAPTKPATSEAPKATAKPSAEAPKPTQPASKAEAPSTQKSTTESAPVAAPASTKPVEPAKSTEPQKAKPTKPTKQAAKPASHEAASKPFANKEHVAESAIEEATKKTPEPPVKAAPATTSPSEDQLREAAEIEILVDRAAEEEAAKIEELVRPFASQATPTMNAEKERELNVGAPVSSSKEKTPTNKEVTPAKASSAPAATPAPTPESTPKPAAKPAPKPAKKAPVDHFAEFSARATALRDQGAYAIAAMLFEEAAALAPNANEARNSHFEELACYVKAGDAAKAKEIAAKLRQSSVLTPLQDEIKSAMKAHDNNRRDILRQVHTELKAIEVNERRDITEADVDAMLKRVIKQTKETLDGSIKAGNNQERTDTLTEQVAILEGYLPEQIEGEALMALIDEAVAETGATTKKDMGRVMGTLTQRTGGNFDKAAAAATLNQRLS